MLLLIIQQMPAPLGPAPQHAPIPNHTNQRCDLCLHPPFMPTAECVPDLGEACPISVTLPSGDTLNGPISLCSVEGVDGGGPVPGVSTTGALPPSKCVRDSQCIDSNYQCNMNLATGKVCTCDAATGSDQCTLFGSCDKTPCKRCSDCLNDVRPHLSARLYETSAARVASSFAAVCAVATLAPVDTCAATTTAIAAYTPGGNLGESSAVLCRHRPGLCMATWKATFQL